MGCDRKWYCDCDISHGVNAVSCECGTARWSYKQKYYDRSTPAHTIFTSDGEKSCQGMERKPRLINLDVRFNISDRSVAVLKDPDRERSADEDRRRRLCSARTMRRLVESELKMQ